MATAQRLETVRRLQTAMAASYTGLGAWALLHPASIIRLGFQPAYTAVTTTASFFCRCWGAQAMTVGVLLATAPMNAFSFKAFAAAMVPYIAFNFWGGLGPGRQIVTQLVWIDFLGNVFFTGASLWCAKLLQENEAGEGDIKKKGL